MKLLLDTHAVLWWLDDDQRLGARARELIADPANDVLVSVVSLWEIVVKTRIGKLEADCKEVFRAIERDGFVPLEIRLPHLLSLVGLPMHHRDPFDHLLIAQAITEAAVFMSEDRNVSRYPVEIITCTDPPPIPA
ncbi:MAG TPA: type II toxin-antitoxin system VapC family toxin [Acetobacteraceae bacterium]